MLTPMDVESVIDDLTAFLAPFQAVLGGYRRAEKATAYIQGLLRPPTARRNAENLAEGMPGLAPRAIQRFLTNPTWGVAGVIALLQATVGHLIGDADGVFIVDDSGLPKQGTHSAGVARQWCGRLGKVANCQIGVYLGYASPAGAALLDGRLYLPANWIADRDRAGAVQIPTALPFQTKIAYALNMLRMAVARGDCPAHWVVADETYGRNRTFREGVAALGLWYVAEIDATTKVRMGTRQVPVATVAAALPVDAWTVVTVADGAQGPRPWRLWAKRVRGAGREAHTVRWLLCRQNLDGREPRYYWANAPLDTPLATFGAVVNQRSRVEQLLEESKGEVGLDEYEVRSWPGWYHHVALTLVAQAFLLSRKREWEKKGAGPDGAASLPAGAGDAAGAGLVRAAGLSAGARDPTAECRGETCACQTARG